MPSWRLSWQKEPWPKPDFNENQQPHFLFLLTPPYSGSTAIAKLLNSACGTMLLHESGEGQWLVPGMCQDDRWDQSKQLDYQSIRATWLSQYQKTNELVGNIEVVIEKSPPNILRIKDISALFYDYSLLANNRNPYASCASILYRKHPVAKLSPDQRIQTLLQIAQRWTNRSRALKSLIEDLRIPFVSYESFCSSPQNLIDALRIPAQIVETIDTTSKVNVKDYDAQPITNQNTRQLSNLTSNEIGELKSYFSSHSELLGFFGYEASNLDSERS